MKGLNLELYLRTISAFFLLRHPSSPRGVEDAMKRLIFWLSLNFFSLHPHDKSDSQMCEDASSRMM